MTKEQLEQLYFLNKEMKQLHAQKERLERLLHDLEVSDCVVGCSTNHPYTKHNIVLSGIAQVDYPTARKYKTQLKEIKLLLEDNSQKCMSEYIRLTKYIQELPDSEIRLILNLRYIDGCSWQQIAFRIGEHDEQYPRRKHNKFLKSNNLTKLTN